jgi:hypothetical protein
MSLLLDSFWRALAYCLHPRVMLLSLMPLALMVLLWLSLGYFFWEPAIDGVRAALESSTLLRTVWGWFESLGIGGLKTVVAPLVVIFAATPVIVIVSLVAVAFLMTPAIVSLVAVRRFPNLHRARGASWVVGLFWTLGSMVLATLALVISVPLWLVPPLILVLPPLIWGWLTYRVMAFDALAGHASKEERREIFRRHRLQLLGMGLLCGYMGAAPSLVWASGALIAAAFVLLVPLAIWIYTFIFAMSSLWFTHYCLAALQRLRAETSPEATDLRADQIDVSSKVLPYEPSPAAPVSAP